MRQHVASRAMNTFEDSLVRALQLVAGADPELVAIVGRSLSVSAAACLIGCCMGLALGSWLGVARFPLRGGVRRP